MGVVQLRLAYAFAVGSATRRWKARFAEVFRSSGHTNPRMFALHFLSRAPQGLSQAELCELLDLSAATVVNLLDLMEARGMIIRRAVPGDRRINRVFIEDQGRRDLAEMEAAAGVLNAEIFSDISENELRNSLRLMHLVTERLIAKTGFEGAGPS